MNNYKFIKTLQDNNYKFTPEELEKLVDSIGYCEDYYRQKMEDIAGQICNLEYVDKYEIEIYKHNDGSTCYEISFFLRDWKLIFDVAENDDVRIVYEFGRDNEGGNYYNSYDCHIGLFCVDTIAFVLNLFENHGQWLDSNNDDIVTLFENNKNMSATKSARTIL